MSDLAQLPVPQKTKRLVLVLCLITLTAITGIALKAFGVRNGSEPVARSDWMPVAGEHWAAVRKLAGVASAYFVVIDPHYETSMGVVDDAGHALCTSAICNIGFFADVEDVPLDTSFVDFLNNGGWLRSGEIAHYSQEGAHQQVKWDCDAIQQAFLEHCLNPPHPTLTQNANVASRPALSGFGSAKFGMSLAELKAALNKHPRIWTFGPAITSDLDTVQTTDSFARVSFNSFYNVIGGKFESVALVLSANVKAAECFQTEKRIAAAVDRRYGERDSFAYYDESRTLNEFLWRFPNAAQISLANLVPSADGCVLRLSFEDTPSDDPRNR